MLTAADPLPSRPQRVLVAGVSGSGKTTLAAQLSKILQLPHTEIDSLFHGPNWEPRADFMCDVDRLTREPRWVTEWQYSSARPVLAERADILIWLDYPVWHSMSRLIRRTVSRRLRGVELWNGNFEGPLWGMVTDRDHIIRWGWRTRHKLRKLVPTLEDKFPQLTVVRMRSQRDVDVWLRGLAEPATSGADAAGKAESNAA
ncbi:adenylate kinase family enzyme [Arthrobacter stackebrandtii]|uniref:Adenylate kinase family enzyme n=1 Tax=Arthrobacter stackebrandtii TaxID=272161 RepID=A0ABS4YXJ8_9MICC|nr:AAA family ATPase [Arthrobacter stackebrandtii]MBP2413210.1 adenylate kinase family enzyme [Arthrobacter stackebrandtii]